MKAGGFEQHRSLFCLLQMQQQELAQMRQRDANLTALAAIGPRKKRKVDSPGTTPSGTEVKTSTAFLFFILYRFTLTRSFWWVLEITLLSEHFSDYFSRLFVLIEQITKKTNSRSFHGKPVGCSFGKNNITISDTAHVFLCFSLGVSFR